MRCLLLAMCLLFSGLISAQEIYISRIIPGWYKGENQHLIELFNPSASAINLSGWLLSTQEYCFQFPAGTIVPGQSVFSIGNARNGKPLPDLNLEKSSGLIVRSAEPIPGGDYVMLLDQNSWFMDGMYYSPYQDVPFLPEQGRCALSGEKIRIFNFPDESDQMWSGRSLSMGEDPAIHFIQIGGNWVPTSANVNLLTAVTYSEFMVSYIKGVVQLNWEAKLEAHSLSFILEKSEDGENFVRVGEVNGTLSASSDAGFSWRDDQVEEGKTYYYRVINRDIFGHEIAVQAKKIEAREESGDFALEVFWGFGKAGKELNVRYFSALDRHVRIKILDEYFREVALLFDDDVRSEDRNLLKVVEALPKGRYLLIADTGDRRVVREVLSE